MDLYAQDHLLNGPCLDEHSVDIWRASYAAAMVRQIFDFMAEGRGSPDDDMMEGFREEAAEVADMILGIE